jgi:uncharacterized protein UPF0158
MRRPTDDRPPPDLATRLREAFTAEDPEAAWYFDRAKEIVVRVAGGETDVPELSAEEVEDDEDRYVEIPALTESEIHAWMEDFVEERGDENVAALLDERQGANPRFLAKLAAADAAAFAAWKEFHATRVAAAVAEWRAGLG